jgi:hypothetical protein
MDLRWECDSDFTDCWDLHDGSRRMWAYIMRTKLKGEIGYFPSRARALFFPGMSVDEVKTVVEAMIRLEG